MIATPASIAARTARPRSTPAIERPEPVACPPASVSAKAGRSNRSLSLAASRPTTPGRPCFPGHDDRSAPFLEAQRQQRFGLGLRQCFDLDLLTDAVQPVELARDRARLEIVGRGQKPDAERRVADASARVDARADDKAQVVGPRRSVGAGDVEQGRKPRPAALTHDREALDDKGAVEPDQRHDVGDGRERNEVERRHKVRTSPAVPEARLAQRAVERHERHKDDARRAEVAQARKIVLTVGIDQRRRLRQRFRGLMVIEHDHVEAKAGLRPRTARG